MTKKTGYTIQLHVGFLNKSDCVCTPVPTSSFSIKKYQNKNKVGFNDMYFPKSNNQNQRYQQKYISLFLSPKIRKAFWMFNSCDM